MSTIKDNDCAACGKEAVCRYKAEYKELKKKIQFAASGCTEDFTNSIPDISVLCKFFAKPDRHVKSF